MTDNNNRRSNNRKPRKPKLKDWIRMVNSQGNGLPNVNVHMIINEATGLVEIETQAYKKKDSTELEDKRTQVFKINSFEVINDASRDPLAKVADDNEPEPAIEG